MRVHWDDLGTARADAIAGRIVRIEGWAATATPQDKATYFLLSPEPICCAGCLPSDPLACVEVFAGCPVRIGDGRVALSGRWQVLADDDLGWRYQLREATPVQAPEAMEPRAAAPYRLTRRRLIASAPLAVAPLVCLGGPLPVRVAMAGPRPDGARPPTVDIHSHAGGILRLDDGEDASGLPLAAPMREGGLAVTCLAIVSDSPTHRVTPEGRIRPFRDPLPGELAAYAQRGFERLHATVAAQGLGIVRTAADLRAATPDKPSVVVSAEGADFLEGRLEYLELAYSKAALRHLQLTHYRVNELGDIQTEAPVHGGLTAFGADVIRRCEAMGIVVDVAHGTFDLVVQAADVARKPLVLSHTSLLDAPMRRTRRITPDHARAIAATGGVVGVWPPMAFFPDVQALADGIARMADVIGPEHVGLGTDAMGLVGKSVLPTYAALPDLVAALRARFTQSETDQILGGNYLRVFEACLKV